MIFRSKDISLISIYAKQIVMLNVLSINDYSRYLYRFKFRFHSELLHNTLECYKICILLH